MTNRVYIGRLSPAARERDVERFFKPYGRIRDINLKNGFGFVEFDSARDADEAVYSCDGKDLMGERVLVELAKGGSSYGRRSSPPMSMGGGGGGGGGSGGGGGGGSSSSSSNFRSGNHGYYYSRGYAKYGPPVRTEYRVVVENLSSRVSWQDLKDFMRVAGRISYADAHRKRVGEGIVEFMSYDDMKTALRKLDGQELHGRCIRLFDGRSRHSPKRSLSRGRSRSHSRGKRHSRSYSRSSSSPSPRRRDRYRDRERERDRSRDRDRRRRSPSHSSQEDSRKKRRRDSHSNESKSESRSPSPSKKSPANDKYSLKSEAESPEHERSPSDSPAKQQSGDEDIQD